ncbi:hypothetical protein BDV96DRAFT_651772 [Lophiotrema nucula]|uniref:Uncharacterized protein n=1 Tax=Lophiotrema nucula TaxID=690887 RepID=A0A6A5YRT9_9PLEO|nr:hypothetical protein BDV96DRAFT_651772 [Lophiotrema nucula]
MKFVTVIFTLSAMLGAVSAIGYADALPQPEVIDVSGLKKRQGGTTPPPISPRKREYEAEAEAPVEEQARPAK